MTEAAEASIAIRVVIDGRVQGVGFRYWVKAEARRRGLDGWVRNLTDGTVEALFAGPFDAVHAMIEVCRQGPPLARVTAVRTFSADPPAGEGFASLPTV